ncbi:chromosome segregation protein SMC [Picrophilus oshimae]|uniref:Chromosome partition protein Smc n=1 Tax=Picrophilus torridus (strain ATCC 700027 / DSM 9790 / JCM 10055 / NBRC 100828 / KAW 2/3) TaxID=1122961 RepID=A0A8G2L6T1_PICTO|nr:chromosome segregation protein SMC [Picrophilus oshimae]SMD30250.1 condensin subunit Smc [Picrophilus oshimae DSM 9789]
MFIESIEIDNFKSYGKKTKIYFKPGFTVIIGPNGSGKSNIGDAILFVLGIRSNKTVRIERLSDLIHKSEKSSRNYCYVELNINDNGNLYSIKREIKKENGEYKSNYYINNNKSKYNDVSNLIDSFHIYLDSYSFVLQGDINNIITMSGSEKRKLFEALAGIESFKEKIENARSDIQGVENNMNTVSALISEISSRLEKLRIEKETAEKYHELSESINSMENYLRFKEKERLLSELEIFQKNVTDIENKIIGLRKKGSENNDELNKTRNDINELEKKINDLSGNEINKIRSEISSINVEIGKIDAIISSEDTELKNIQMKLKTAEEALAFSEKNMKKQIDERDSKLKRLSIIESNVSKAAKELEHFREENLNRSKRLSELNLKLKSIDEKIKIKSDEIGSINERKSDYINKKSSLLKESSILEEELKNLRLKENDLKWRIKNSEIEMNDIENSMKTANKNYELLRTETYNISENIKNNNSKIKSLERELRNLNYRPVVSEALKEIYALKDVLKGIYGQVKDLIDYRDDYSNAIIAGAGSRLYNIVVDSDLTAQRCIETLKEKKLGRLTFLPVNKILKPRDHPKAIDLINSDGILGFLRDFVSYDKEFENIIYYVFSDTLLADSMETARKHMTGVRIVTLSGEIFEPAGAITGGYLKNDELIYSKITKEISNLENENNILNDELKVKSDELNRISAALINITKKNTALVENIKNYKSSIEETVISINEKEKKLGEIKNAINEIEKGIQKLSFDEDSLKLDLYKLNNEKSEIFNELKKISPEDLEIEKSMQKNLDELNNEYNNAKNEISILMNDIDHLNERINDLKSRISSYNNEIASKSSNIKNLNDKKESMEFELNKKNLMLSRLESSFKEVFNQIESKKRYYYELEKRQKEIDDSINENNIIIVNMKSRMENISLKINEINSSLNGDIKEYNKSISEIKALVDKYKSEINALGPINQMAVSEYNETLERYGENMEKYKKLESERSELREIESRLINEEKMAFLDLFNNINNEFKDIYSRLSDGGEATLELSNQNDPLNSEVFIKARPKGKYMIKIESLSGGEKSLAALSLIMAFQRAKPSPFYYLDEVDMFLDGYNAEHMGSMFKENSRHAQIIMVSLKGAVSKYADHIIGVTTYDKENTEIIEKSLDDE